MKNAFKNMSREKREKLLAMVFGPWMERAKLNEILFPIQRTGKAGFLPCGSY